MKRNLKFLAWWLLAFLLAVWANGFIQQMYMLLGQP